MYSELGRSPGASLFLRGSAPSPCGAQVAFRLCHGKVPRPRRCSDEHFLVKPFSRVLVRGISPDPCACCASAPSQPQSLLIRGISPNPCGAQVAFRLCWRKVPRPHRSADADSLVEPFGDAFAGRLRCLDVCDISLPLRRAARAAPAGVAFRLCVAKSRDRAGALMSTF